MPQFVWAEQARPSHNIRKYGFKRPRSQCLNRASRRNGLHIHLNAHSGELTLYDKGNSFVIGWNKTGECERWICLQTSGGTFGIERHTCDIVIEGPTSRPHESNGGSCMSVECVA